MANAVHQFETFDGAVFRGTVIAISSHPEGGTNFRFRIERHWKGVTSPELTVWVPTNSDCVEDRSWSVGSTYLVTAINQPFAGRLESDRCSNQRMSFVTALPDSDFRAAFGEGRAPPSSR